MKSMNKSKLFFFSRTFTLRREPDPMEKDVNFLVGFCGFSEGLQVIGNHESSKAHAINSTWRIIPVSK